MLSVNNYHSSSALLKHVVVHLLKHTNSNLMWRVTLPCTNVRIVMLRAQLSNHCKIIKQRLTPESSLSKFIIIIILKPGYCKNSGKNNL